MKILSCKETTRLVSQGLDRRLGFGERLVVRIHLAICEGCSNFTRQVKFLRRALTRLADPGEKAGLKERSAPGPRS